MNCRYLFLLVLICFSTSNAGDLSGMPPGWHAPMAYPTGPLFDDNAVQRVLAGPKYSSSLYPGGSDAFAPNAVQSAGLATLAFKLLKPVVTRVIWNESINAANRVVDSYQSESHPPKPVPVPPQPPAPQALDLNKPVQQVVDNRNDSRIPQSSLDRAKEMQEYINNLTLPELSVLAQQEEQYHPHINFYRVRYYQMLSGTPIISLKDTPHPLMCMTTPANNGLAQLPGIPPSI